MKKIILIIALFGSVYALMGFSCGSNYPPPTPGGGFFIQTFVNGLATSVDASGNWTSDISRAQGSAYSFATATDSVGGAYIGNGRAPANWNFFEQSDPCAGLGSPGQSYLQGTTQLICVSTTGLSYGGNYTASPNPLSSSDVPAAVSISGRGFTTTYGMPRVEYYYNDGTYVGEVTATKASSTTISAPPVSGLSSDPSGIYVGLIQNATAGGGWTTIGIAALNLATPKPPVIGSGGSGGCGTCGCGQKCSQWAPPSSRTP
ncbi:MAG: hypothetical protein WBC78_23190 [Candidatus Sulfotelmatobacter sp.]